MISVIVPVYNAETYLNECIDSILRQTHRDFELILIDDGSTDTSGELCDLYASKDSRVQVVHTANHGASAARNTGIDRANGDYILFIDSDDTIDPDYIEILYQHRMPGGLSACCLRRNKERLFCPKETSFDSDAAQVPAFSQFGFQGFSVCKLYDTSIINKHAIRFDTSLKICEDLLFCVQYLRHAENNTFFTDANPYWYRAQNNGATKRRYLESSKICFSDMEMPAIRRCNRFLFQNKQTKHAYDLRITKAAISDIRLLAATGNKHKKLYQTLLKLIRKKAFFILSSNQHIVSTKISALASAISPRLELMIWKVRNKS